jgi:HlyD family secretion protein
MKASLRRVGGRVAAVLLLGLAIVWGARLFAPSPVEVDLVPVRVGRLVVTVEEEGTTRVRDRYTVSAPVAGLLQRLAVHEGDRVEAGAVLARIAPGAVPLLDRKEEEEARARAAAAGEAVRRASATVRAAEATHAAARREHERLALLLKRDAVTRQEADEAHDTEAARRADLEAARAGASAAHRAMQAKTRGFF